MNIDSFLKQNKESDNLLHMNSLRWKERRVAENQLFLEIRTQHYSATLKILSLPTNWELKNQMNQGYIISIHNNICSSSSVHSNADLYLLKDESLESIICNENESYLSSNFRFSIVWYEIWNMSKFPNTLIFLRQYKYNFPFQPKYFTLGVTKCFVYRRYMKMTI